MTDIAMTNVVINLEKCKEENDPAKQDETL
jgi:hypothetical protein